MIQFIIDCRLPFIASFAVGLWLVISIGSRPWDKKVRRRNGRS